MEEEDDIVFSHKISIRGYESPKPICTCLSQAASSEETIAIPPRKENVLSTVARTESYLRERRIPELIRFLLTKVIAEASDQPIDFLEKLLDACMLFRAGHGVAPVLYEQRHLEAVVKSFDPCNRGWLSGGQIRRVYITLGLNPEHCNKLNERQSTEVILEHLMCTQDLELFNLLSAGMIEEGDQSTESTI